MGYPEAKRSENAGVIAVIVVAVPLLAIAVVLLLTIGGIFWLRSTKLQARPPAILPVTVEKEVVPVPPRIAPPVTAVAPPAVPKLPTVPAPPAINVHLDQDGAISIGETKLTIDELQARLTALSKDAQRPLTVSLSADPNCQFQHLVSVLHVGQEVGEIDMKIATPPDVAAKVAAP